MLSAGAVSAAASECQRLTSNEKVVVCEVVPLLPVIVIVRVPVLAFLETVMVKVEVPEPGAVIEAGLKLPVTPDGKPDADKATAALKPPETVVVTTT